MRMPGLYPALTSWETRWGAPAPFTRDNCFCRFVVEPNYKPDARYFWCAAAARHRGTGETDETDETDETGGQKHSDHAARPTRPV